MARQHRRTHDPSKQRIRLSNTLHLASSLSLLLHYRCTSHKTEQEAVPVEGATAGYMPAGRLFYKGNMGHRLRRPLKIERLDRYGKGIAGDRLRIP